MRSRRNSTVAPAALVFIRTHMPQAPRPCIASCREGRHRTSPIASQPSGQAERELSRAFGARATFSLRAQGESNQRERAPRLALAGPRATAPALPRRGPPCPRLPGKSVSRGRASRQRIPMLSKRNRRPVGSRCAVARAKSRAAEEPGGVAPDRASPRSPGYSKPACAGA